MLCVLCTPGLVQEGVVHDLTSNSGILPVFKLPHCILLCRLEILMT